DLFALGSLLYRATTGEPAFPGDVTDIVRTIHGVETWLAHRSNSRPVDERIPGMWPLLRQCLRSEPEDRFASAEDLELALEDLLGTLPNGPGLRHWLRQRKTSPADDPGRTMVIPPDTAESEVTVTAHVARRTNLASTPDRFVGRAADLRQLESWWASDAPLGTLLGPGGMGKTRLARTFAAGRYRQLAQEGGVWFCDLTEARDQTAIVRIVSETLGIPLNHRDPRAQTQELGEALAGHGAILLVLDNFEQVAHLAGATLDTWLDHAPCARMLVTSQHPLNLSREQKLPLGPLTRQDAIRLFRVRAEKAGAPPDQTQTDTLTRLVDRLERWPLAIELAAARCATLQPDEILDRLAHSLEPLDDSSDSHRHATLRATITWSWSLLRPWEQDALAQCSVFRGGFFVDQAERLLDLSAHPDAPSRMTVLSDLLDRSLLQAFSLPSMPDEPRLHMVESVRRFASEQLDRSAGREAAESRHTQVFLALAPTSSLLNRSLVNIQSVTRLHADTENFVAVAERNFQGNPDYAFRTILRIAPFLFQVGHLDRILHLLDQAFEGGGLRQRYLLCLATTERGSCLDALNRFEESEKDLERAHRIANELGDGDLQANVWLNQAINLLQRGELTRVTGLLERARALLQATGNDFLLTRLLQVQATVLNYEGQGQQARELFLQSLALCHE
ncbi:MAG: AAA family ATPase, partial [Myxococcota bacterium]|nr:AAA family ATPase [Myxococcota bacterium]